MKRGQLRFKVGTSDSINRQAEAPIDSLVGAKCDPIEPFLENGTCSKELLHAGRNKARDKIMTGECAVISTVMFLGGKVQNVGQWHSEQHGHGDGTLIQSLRHANKVVFGHNFINVIYRIRLGPHIRLGR
jgi:hypothetical protein